MPRPPKAKPAKPSRHARSFRLTSWDVELLSALAAHTGQNASAVFREGMRRMAEHYKVPLPKGAK